MHTHQIVNGAAVAEVIYGRVRTLISKCQIPPTLAIVTCDPQGPSQRYVRLKERQAEKLGVTVRHFDVAPNCTTAELIGVVTHAVRESSGVIVQLPLPPHLDTDAVLRAIPKSHDVDAFFYEGEGAVMPPVLGAIVAIAEYYNVSLQGKSIAVLGYGRLVGKPFHTYANAQQLHVSIITEVTKAPERVLKNAEVIVAGVGVAGLVTPDNVKDGVVIFDAGTSEQGGALVGDVSPLVAEKASLFTPVPGGIGPVTMAILFLNSVLLAQRTD